MFAKPTHSQAKSRKLSERLNKGTDGLLSAGESVVFERRLRNGYEFVLPESKFERMSDHLQEPRGDEHTIKLDGTGITLETIAKLVQDLLPAAGCLSEQPRDALGRHDPVPAKPDQRG